MDNAFGLDWSRLRSVLAVAEWGSLSAAAAAIGHSQPTLGRHIRAAEDTLGQPLFRRHARGLTPTPFCDGLLPAIRQMAAAAKQVELQAAGSAPEARGRVRLTASVFVTSYILPHILADLRQDFPQIAVDVVSSDTTENLLFHEADIALRMYRPTQLDIVTRHLGDLPLGLYAAESYVSRRGIPDRPDALWDHDVIGYDRDDRIIRGMRSIGFDVERDWFTTCTDDQVAYWKMVLAGCGIGVGQVLVAERVPGMRRVLPELPLPDLPVWLAAHPALRHQPRVAAIWAALDRAVSALLS